MTTVNPTEKPPVAVGEDATKPFLIFFALFFFCFLTLRQASDGAYTFDDVVQVGKLGGSDATLYGPWWPQAEGRRDWRPVTRVALVFLEKPFSARKIEPEQLNIERGFTKFLFVLSICMLFLIARQWGWTDSQAALAAIIASYAPIRGEPLHQIVGQTETFAAIFMFAGLLHHRLLRADKNPAGFIVWQAAFYTLALGSKETALLYPLYLGLQELALGGSDFRRLPRRFWVTQGALGIMLVLYLIARNAVTGGLIRPAVPPPVFENVFVAMTFFERIPAALGGLGWAVTRFFVPVGLSPDYSAYSLPFERGWAWPMAWLGAGLVGAAVAGAVISFRKRGRAWALIVGGLAAWALTSNLFFTIGVSVASRIWAFPSLALALGVGWAAGGSIPRLWRAGRTRPALYLGLTVALWLLSLAGVGLIRRFDWRSNLDFSARTVEVFPESWRGRHNLSRELFEARRFEEGLEHARVAVRLQPRAARSWDQLGLNAMFTEGGAAEAEAAFRRAIELDPTLDLVQKHLENLRKMTPPKS